MGNSLRKKVLVSQKALEVVVGEETLLLTLEFKNKTKDAPYISDSAPVVEVYSGDDSIQRESHWRCHYVDQHSCELYITIEGRLEEERAKVKLKLNSGYALSKECVFVRVLDQGTSEEIRLTSGSSHDGVCRASKKAREKQGNVLLQNEYSQAYTYYGYMHGAMRDYNVKKTASRDFSTTEQKDLNEIRQQVASPSKEHDTSSTQKEDDTSSTKKEHDISSTHKVHDTSSTQKEGDTSSTKKEHDTSSTKTVHDTSSTQKGHPLTYQRNKSDVSQSTSTTPALNNNTISSASATKTQRIIGARPSPTPTSSNTDIFVQTTTAKQPYISRPRPIERKSTLSHPLALKNTCVSSALNGRSSANDASKNTAASRRKSEAASTVRGSYDVSSTARTLTSQYYPSPTDNIPTTPATDNKLVIQPPRRSDSTDIFNKTTTGSRSSVASPTTTTGNLSNHSALRNAPLPAPALNGRSSANEVNASKNRASERKFEGGSTVPVSCYAPAIHTTSVVNNTSKPTSHESSQNEPLSSWYRSFVLRSSAEKQSTQCDPLSLNDARPTSTDKSNSCASVTNHHQFPTRPTSTSNNTDIFVPTTTAKQPPIPRPRSSAIKTTLSNPSALKNTYISPVLNGHSSASANEVRVNAATKNTESEKKLEATSYHALPIRRTQVLDKNSSKQQTSPELLAWEQLASFVSSSTAERQMIQCDPSSLHRTPTTAAGNRNSSCGSVTTQDYSVIQPSGHSIGQSSVSSPKAIITPSNPSALKNRSANRAGNGSSPISISKTNATGNTDPKRKSASSSAVRDHSVSKDSTTTQVRPPYSYEQGLAFGVNGRSKEQPFKVSPPKRYFLSNLTFTAERSSLDPLQSDIHQLYYHTWTIFEADIIDYYGDQYATDVDIVQVTSSSYGVQFDNTYTATDGRLRIRLRAFYHFLDSFEMFITLRCWNNSAEVVIKELVHVNRPADVLRIPAPSVPGAVTKDPKRLNSSAFHSTSTTPVLENSSSKQQTSLDRSSLVNRPADVLRMPAPSVPGALTSNPKPLNSSALHSTSTTPVLGNSSSKQQTKLDRSSLVNRSADVLQKAASSVASALTNNPKPLNSSALHSTSTTPVLDNSSSKQQTSLDRLVSPQRRHPMPSKTATGNLPFASSSAARKLTGGPSSTDSTPTSAGNSTSCSSAIGQNKLVIEPPTRSASTDVLNEIPTAGRSSIASPTVRKGTFPNPSVLRNTSRPLVPNGRRPTVNDANATDKTKSERKLAASTPSLQNVDSPLTSAIPSFNGSSSTQPTGPDRLASPGVAPTHLKAAYEDHVLCRTTRKLAQFTPSAQRSTPTTTQKHGQPTVTSEDLSVVQPLRYSMCTNVLKDKANPTSAPSPTARKEIPPPNSKAGKNRCANETLGGSRSIPTSGVNDTDNSNSKRKSASKMRDGVLNTTATTSLLFPPPSVDHSAIGVASPVHLPVKAGETLVFKIDVRDQNGREVNSSVQYELLVKLRNKTVIPSNRNNPTTFQVTPQCSGKNTVSFSIDGKAKTWQFDVLPSKPSSLRNVKFTTDPSSLDPRFRPLNDRLYDNVWATLEADIQDKFGNVVEDVDNIQASGTSSGIQFDTCTATDGKLKLRLKASAPLYHPETKEIRIKLKSTDSEDETVLERKVDVIHAPLFSRVTSETKVCTVGKKHKIQVKIMNVFNKPVRTQAAVNCVVYTKTLEPHFRAGEYNRCDSDVIYKAEDENHDGKVQLDVTIIPKRVGPRQILVYLNGEKMDSSEANFEVRPNLEKLQCRSIRRLQREGEPAILEASIEDCGGNSIALDTIGDIRLVQISGPRNGLTCQSTKIQSNVVLIEHTLLENKRYFLRLETDHADVIHKFEVDTYDDIPQSNDPEDKQFLLYSENMCRITKVGIACRGATKRDIKGPDCAYLKNIKRVLNLREKVDLTVDRPTGDTQIRFGPNVSTKFLRTCRELVLHLLRGIHYRKKASEVARLRMVWKERVEILEERKNHLDQRRTVVPERLKSIPWTLEHCRSERNTYGNLMNEYNRQASFELFAFFNYERKQNEVDLHGLLVADEKKYPALRKTLKDKKVKDLTIEKIISRCRWEGDEAIRKLEDKLRSFDLESARESGEPWIEIVVGAGHHSRETQKIRPKVENFLRERSTEFAPVNKGSLVVTLEKYDGPEPCFAEYYCQECHRCWRSGQSWSNRPQACESCKVTKKKEVDCWPVKQSAEERSNSNWSAERPPRNRAEMQHKVDLCKECKRLGHPCYELKSNRRSARSANP